MTPDGHRRDDLLTCVQEDCAESVSGAYVVPDVMGFRARFRTKRIGDTVFIHDSATGADLQLLLMPAARTGPVGLEHSRPTEARTDTERHATTSAGPGHLVGVTVTKPSVTEVPPPYDPRRPDDWQWRGPGSEARPGKSFAIGWGKCRWCGSWLGAYCPCTEARPTRNYVRWRWLDSEQTKWAWVDEQPEARP